MDFAPARASSRLCATPEMGTSSPILSINSLKAKRSSPLWRASGLAPIISTIVPGERAVFVQRHGGVEGGLAAEGGEQDELMRGLGAGVRVLGNAHFAHLFLLGG